MPSSKQIINLFRSGALQTQLKHLRVLFLPSLVSFCQMNQFRFFASLWLIFFLTERHPTLLKLILPFFQFQFSRLSYLCLRHTVLLRLQFSFFDYAFFSTTFIKSLWAFYPLVFVSLLLNNLPPAFVTVTD